jgi:hypothetical protein
VIKINKVHNSTVLLNWNLFKFEVVLLRYRELEFSVRGTVPLLVQYHCCLMNQSSYLSPSLLCLHYFLLRRRSRKQLSQGTCCRMNANGVGVASKASQRDARLRWYPCWRSTAVGTQQRVWEPSLPELTKLRLGLALSA